MSVNETAIIVLNWNGKKLLKNCFESVYSQSYKNFKLIFVDNGSSDDSIDFVKKNFPKAEIISLKENLGYTGGNNIGIRDVLRKSYKYLLILNNDTILDKDCIKRMVEVIRKDKKIGVVGPLIYELPKSAKKIYSGYGIMDFRIGAPRNIASIDKSKIYDVDSLLGCAFLVRREVYWRVGLPDEDFYMYWDDYDFLQRVRRGGFRIVFAPFANLYHICGASSANTSFPRRYYQTRNRLMLVSKYGKSYEKICFFLYFLLKLPYLIIRQKNLREIYLIICGISDFIIRKMGKRTDFYFFKSL